METILFARQMFNEMCTNNQYRNASFIWSNNFDYNDPDIFILKCTKTDDLDVKVLMIEQNSENYSFQMIQTPLNSNDHTQYKYIFFANVRSLILFIENTDAKCSERFDKKK